MAPRRFLRLQLQSSSEDEASSAGRDYGEVYSYTEPEDVQQEDLEEDPQEEEELVEKEPERVREDVQVYRESDDEDLEEDPDEEEEREVEFYGESEDVQVQQEDLEEDPEEPESVEKEPEEEREEVDPDSPISHLQSSFTSDNYVTDEFYDSDADADSAQYTINPSAVRTMPKMLGKRSLEEEDPEEEEEEEELVEKEPKEEREEVERVEEEEDSPISHLQSPFTSDNYVRDEFYYSDNTDSDDQILLRNRATHEYTIKPYVSAVRTMPKMLGKRPLETEPKVADSRNKRTKVDKKSGTYRLWSEEDEIIILKGMHDYKTEKRADHPYADMNAFYKYVKNSLHVVGASKSQLMDKIKRLKKKYQNNVEKAESTGENPVFSKPHEDILFKLSKKIWGTEANILVVSRKRSNATKSAAADEEDFWSLYPCLKESLQLEQFFKYSLPDSGKNFVKERLSSIGRLRAKELENKWRKLHKAETEVNLMRTQLIQEQTKFILDAM